MKHQRSTLLAAALVAGCLSATAWAADTSADTSTAPSAKDMDNTAQRAHSKGATAADADSAAKSKGASGGSANASQEVASGKTRDWGKIDSNDDNLIEPAEMQKFLDAQHADNDNASSSAASQKK